MKILNFGSLNIDHVYQVDNIVRPGETIRGREMHIYCGGKGLNQSIALANAGAEVYHAGVVGLDGKILREKLREHGVHTELIREREGSSSHTIIQVNPDGDNSIIFYADENLDVDEAFVREVLDQFEAGDYLLVQNELDHTDLIIRMAKARGMKIVLNPSPFTESLLEYPLECVDIFMVNEIEGYQLTGESAPEHILDVMHEKYPNAVIVLTMGDKGACCLADDRIIVQKACEVDTVDTTAAGDTFTGFFIAEYLRGQILEASLALAAKAASITVTLPGAADSIPRLEDIE